MSPVCELVDELLVLDVEARDRAAEGAGSGARRADSGPALEACRRGAGCMLMLVAGAKLQLPTEEQPRTRLVDGLVQRSFPIEGTQGEVELRGAGSFRAHEQIDIPDGED